MKISHPDNRAVSFPPSDYLGDSKKMQGAGAAGLHSRLACGGKSCSNKFREHSAAVVRGIFEAHGKSDDETWHSLNHARKQPISDERLSAQLFLSQGCQIASPQRKR